MPFANKKIHTMICGAIGLMMAGCASGWQATQHHDDFTNSNVCRVEKGTQGERTFARAFTGIYFTQHFYAENNNGEIRAGVRTEPALPIGGDIQIKVGEKLYTLTSKDVPLDITPSIPLSPTTSPEMTEQMKAMTSNIQQLSSPYRAFRGTKAKGLLRDMVAQGGEVKFRVVGVNQQISGTGSFMIEDDFIQALSDCDINL